MCLIPAERPYDKNGGFSEEEEAHLWADALAHTGESQTAPTNFEFA